MCKTFSVPSSVGYAQNYYVLRTEAGRREWIDSWRGLHGIEDGSGGVSWFRPSGGRNFEFVEHWTEQTDAMVRCLPPEHSRDVAELVESIAKYTDAGHPKYDPEFHADVLADNPNFWRPIARA